MFTDQLNDAILKLLKIFLSGPESNNALTNALFDNAIVNRLIPETS